MTQGRNKIPTGLLLIGIMKLVTALLLCATALGIFKLIHKDVGEVLEQYVMLLHLDPNQHVITQALAKVSGLSDRQLKGIGAGTLVYSLLYAIEGIGLLLRKHWAEYLVIIITGSLLPLELYELYEKISVIRTGVLTVNLIILGYLIWRLKQDRKEKMHPPQP